MPPKKNISYHNRSSTHLYLSPSIPLLPPDTTRLMPVLSRIPTPSDFSTDEDVPGYLSGSLDVLSPPSLSNNRSGLTGYGPEKPFRSANPAAADHFRRPDPNVWSGSAAGLQEHGRRTHISEDRRSRSHIYVSSDDPEPAPTEFLTLQKENSMLKIQCGQLRGEITGLR